MRKLSIIASTLLLTSSIYAQDIAMTSNWQLKGATENISNMSVFSENCVNIVWTYDGSWKAYSANPSTLETISSTLGASNIVSSIDIGKGFWVSGNNNCTIDTNIAQSPAFVSGKTIAIDLDYPTTMIFSEDGSYSESGYNGLGQTQYYSCTGKWKYLSDKNVAVTCEESGTTVVPTSSDLTFAFASETITTGMNVSIYEHGLSGSYDTTTVIPASTVIDLSGSWSGTSLAYVNSYSSEYTCTWNLAITVNLDDSASVIATLSNYGTGIIVGDDCDSFSSTSGTISNKTSSGFTFNAFDSTSDYLYGGNTFNFTLNNNVATESKNFTIDSYASTRTTTITK